MNKDQSQKSKSIESTSVSEEIIEKINFNSSHFIRYTDTLYFDLSLLSDRYKFREEVALINVNRDEDIKLSPDLKSAIIFKIIEVESNPETIPLMPESVRKLFKLGEFAEELLEKESETNQPPNSELSQL